MSRIAGILVLLGALPVLAYVAMTAGYRLDAITLGDLFGALRGWLGKAIMVGTVVLALGLILSVVGRRAGLALVALLLAGGSGTVLYSLGEMKRVGGEVPRIHDITTDTIDPPVFVSTAAERTDTENPAAYDGTQSAPQIAYYPDIKTVSFQRPIDEVFNAGVAALKSVGVKNISSDEGEGRIEGTATTFWFGFKDDVVIRVRPGPNGETLVDIRSKSRVGISDLGANAERIRKIRDAMETTLGASA
ncbi:MAG: DUF1499 domain-containing protein [Parvularcula sp.]